MKLTDVMDEIAERLRQVPSLAGRTYEWPKASITAPAAIVTYPTHGDFDETYARGRDRWDGVVAVCAGKPTDRGTREQVGGYVDGSGPESVKEALEAEGYASCDSVTVTGWDIDIWQVGGVDSLTAVFALDIWGPGEGE